MKKEEFEKWCDELRAEGSVYLIDNVNALDLLSILAESYITAASQYSL